MATVRFSPLRLFSPPPPRAASSSRLPPPPRIFFPSTTPATGHLSLAHHLRRLYGPSPTRLLTVAFAVGKLSETELLPVPSDPEGFKDANIPTGAGVYGVYDANEALQFVGISRNIAGSVLLHKKALPELCCSVKAGVVDAPASDGNSSSSSILTDAWKSWMQEHIDSTGQVPPGNQTGNTTWQRRRPNKPADLRLTPGRHVQLTIPLEQLIDRVVKETKVVAFIKGSRNAPRCGFSERVVGILDSHGVVYDSVDVLDEEHNYGLREKLKEYSNWPTFPQIFVDGEFIGGCDILSAMHERGEISKLLDQSG